MRKVMQQIKPEEPRRHHYVSRFHLEGFILTGSNNEKLSVYNKQLRKEYTGSPEDVGHERDYNRLDVVPHADPFVFEKLIGANFESRAAKLFKQIVANRQLPSRDSQDFVTLLNYVAFAAVRVPG